MENIKLINIKLDGIKNLENRRKNRELDHDKCYYKKKEN